ncbi:MAG: tyrosine-type recombinase/integrase [Candidatus Bipolaricaulia bacterium]
MARVDGRSLKTIELYHYVFDSFTQFLETKTTSPTDIKVFTIRSYLAHLQDRGLKTTTIAIHLRVLKALFNWLVREGFMTKVQNPAGEIKSPRTSKRYPFILSDAQVAALLKVPDRTTWTGFRNYTILLTFLDVGLRLNELINLEIGDLNLTQRSLKIHGKGAKDRVCFMGGRLTKAMKRWIDLRGYQPYSEEVFITHIGDRLQPRRVQHIVSQLGDKARIKGVRISPHTLRHTSATLAVRNGLDVFSLQRLFGWEKVETAMRYIHMSGRALQEAFSRASPVDRLLGGK